MADENMDFSIVKFLFNLQMLNSYWSKSVSDVYVGSNIQGVVCRKYPKCDLVFKYIYLKSL